MHKLCNGKVPPLHADVLDETDRVMIAQFESAKNKVEENLEHYKFRDALFEVMDLARKGNKYLQEKEPWKKSSGDKSNPASPENQKLVDNCLHIALQLTANLSILINPFLPFTAKKMLHMMKVVEKILDWENAGKSGLLKTGYTLREPQLLFRKMEDTEIAAQVEKLRAGLVKIPGIENNTTPHAADKTQLPDNHSPMKETIQFDDFAKLDLRVGLIVSAEKVEKADKLLKLEIDLGFEKRTILSGIALHFKPEEILNKQVVVVANLAPRKMRGIESQGMILMAEDKKGKLHFISPESIIPSGSAVS